MELKWIALLGKFEATADRLLFKGGSLEPSPQFPDIEQYEVGNFLTNQSFGGGRIAARITFLGDPLKQACEFILYHNPQARAFLTAGFSAFSLCSIRAFASIGPGFGTVYAQAGPHEQLKANQTYYLEVSVRGSRATVSVDGVPVLVHVLPFVVARGNAGLWCYGPNDICVESYSMLPEQPVAFVVMEFSALYDSIYRDVIRPVCEDAGLRPHRADETFGPGLIIADIERRIAEARVVIVDVTPTNANVFYELGYAHAMRKPTILVAQVGTTLPFDVSPFRTLFYENTIAGKAKLESGLRDHILAIQAELAGS